MKRPAAMECARGDEHRNFEHMEVYKVTRGS